MSDMGILNAEVQSIAEQPVIEADLVKALSNGSPLLIVSILIIVLGRQVIAFMDRREQLIHERETSKIKAEAERGKDK